MAHIFIANATMQHQQLEYRMPGPPGKGPLRRVMIRAGGQELLPDDLDQAALDFVLPQLHQNGAVPSNDPKAITRPLSLIYTVVKVSLPATIAKVAIKADQINEARERDIEARQDRSSKIIEQTGLAHFDKADKQIIGGVRETTLEVVELKDQDREEEAKNGVSHEVTVSKNVRSKETRETGRGRRR